MESISLRRDDCDAGGDDVEDSSAVCLRSGLQAVVFLSLRGTIGGVVVILGLGGGRTNSKGGGVERSRAGDSKDKLAKDVSGDMEGGIRLVSGDSKC